jgi:CxxC motif-containing protein (DUF1111 family)
MEPRSAQGGVGRFGWRGQTATLRDFVLTACANELGLETAGHSQARDPLRTAYRAPGDDISTEECDALVAYVAALPKPRTDRPAHRDEDDTIDLGEAAFHSVGCADCHRERLENVVGIYSDLLLHDLGPRLADPVGALPAPLSGSRSGLGCGAPSPTQVARTQAPQVQTVQDASTPPAPSGYSGAGSISLASSKSRRTTPPEQEWRTPPLWGVRDSAPYLHDGRAATLAEAIELHAGEAEFAVDKYHSLPKSRRAALVAFLQTLAARE